jgi:predicted branched-subunit amino acid permease
VDPQPAVDRPGRVSARTLAAIDRDAVRDVTPIVLSLVPFAAIIGVAIGQGVVVHPALGLLAGPLLYAGSAQLAALTLLEGGAGLVSVIATVTIINARLSMYGAVLEPHFRAQPSWFRWLAPHFIVDQTSALALARDDLSDPGRFRRYWLTTGVLLGSGWTLVMGGAILLAPQVAAGSPLTFASAAVYIGLVVPRLRSPGARLPALLAAAVALAAAPLPNGLAPLLGALAGVTPALLRGRSGR